MNGAEAMLSTLADSGVSACFSNPGTSEMQTVSAFDREPRVRPVLCLFEGVATGAADGFGRMSDMPASTLLHLGAGLANGGANLHNARRAGTPIVNIVGDHATYHRGHDAPLTSDIAGLARPLSVWVGSPETPDEAADLAAECVARAMGPVEMEVAGVGVEAVVREFGEHRFGRDVEGQQLADADEAFFAEIVRGVVAEQLALDTAIRRRLAANWKLERLDSTVRAVLRCAAYELRSRHDVPCEVVIDEYIELAKAFVDAKEVAFVNGALDAVARDLRPD